MASSCSGKTLGATALPKVNYIFSPDFLPCDRRYFIVGEPDAIPLLQKLSRFKIAGTIKSNDVQSVDASSSILIVASFWPQDVDTLLAAGISADRIFVLLHHTPDPYGWWEILRSLPGPFEPAAPIENQLVAFREHLGHWGNAKIAHNRIFSVKEYYIRHSKSIVENAAPLIHRVMRELADGKSIEAYARVIYGKPEDMFGSLVENAMADQQYCEIVRLRPGDHIVNCGVGAAWELPNFIVMLEGRGRIYNVDPVMFDPLTDGRDLFSARGTMLKFGHLITDVKVGVSDTDGPKEYTFAYGMYYDVRDQILPPDGDRSTVVIDTCRIDTLVKRGTIERMDYLKFDIEGSELAALRGAINSIKLFRPQIAVSIYHALSHFWDIPVYLMNELSDYDFYIRSYTYHRFETLLYAIPKEDRGSRPARNNSVPRLGETPPPPKGAAYLRFYLHDNDDRTGYDTARRNILTRFSGCDWSGAELCPGPNVAGLESIVVVEQDHDSLIVARNVEDKSIFLGRLSESGVHWIVGASLPGYCVGFAGLLDGRVVLPAQDLETGRIALAELDAKGIHWIHRRDFRGVAVTNGSLVGLWNPTAKADPMLLIRDADGFRLQGLYDDGVMRLDLDAATVLLGCAVTRPFGATKAATQVALVVQASEKNLARMLVSDGGAKLRNVGEIDLSQFRLAPTICGIEPVGFGKDMATRFRRAMRSVRARVLNKG